MIEEAIAFSRPLLDFFSLCSSFDPYSNGSIQNEAVGLSGNLFWHRSVVSHTQHDLSLSNAFQNPWLLSALLFGLLFA